MDEGIEVREPEGELVGMELEGLNVLGEGDVGLAVCSIVGEPVGMELEGFIVVGESEIEVFLIVGERVLEGLTVLFAVGFQVL